MEQSTSWENNIPSAGQKILRLLWDLNIRYRVNTAFQPTLSLGRSMQSTPPTYFWMIHYSNHLPHLRLDFTSSLFLPVNPNQNSVYT